MKDLTLTDDWTGEGSLSCYWRFNKQYPIGLEVDRRWVGLSRAEARRLGKYLLKLADLKKK